MKMILRFYGWLQWKWVYLTTREATEEEAEMIDRFFAELSADEEKYK